MAAALVALLTWIVLATSTTLAAGAGIECGWQPMPDGSPSYECVVQVAPELLNSLQRGDSIPLTVDVPEHIRPIGRIRLVASDQSVPRQTLAHNLKPWPESAKKSRDGVVETQFTTSSSDPRYANQQATNGAVVPFQGMAQAQDEFARQMQNGGQAVRAAVGQMTQDVLPPDPGRSVANAIDRTSQEFGNNLRSASDSVQNDIRQLFGNDPASEKSSPILPPGTQPTQPILPGDGTTAANNRTRVDQPVNPPAGNNWQSSQPQSNPANGNNPIKPPGGFDSQWADNSGAQPPTSAGSPQSVNPVGDRYPFAGNSGTILPQHSAPAGSVPSDQYRSAGQSQSAGLPSADSRNSALGSSPSTGTGPSFPAFTPTLGNEQSPITPTPISASSTPEIRRDMLSQPPNAEIQGANGMPIGHHPVNGSQLAAQTPTSQSALPSSNFDRDTPSRPQQSVSQQPTGPGDTASSVFPLLLSWVLLSGSGAGNLYLFWSYLDVRNKYHDLVDDASRRISGRRVRD